MRRPPQSKPARGFTLIALLSLLIAGILAFLLATLGPEAMEAWRARRTEGALAEAREALLGYAMRYRDSIDTAAVYGYLPLPDLGTSRNANADPNCHVGGNPANAPLEGCDAAHAAGIAYDTDGIGPTVIGRFPWRTLGTSPVRDGYGECLWLIISKPFGRIARSSPPPVLPPMNWDTLGQLDVVVANGTAALTTSLASAHDRPVAIIFSPGIALPNQNRGVIGGDDVTECGGNYDVANYLDPDTAGALAGVTNYFGGSTNNASGDTSALPKDMASQGPIFKASDNKFWPNACPSGSNCTLASNDRGITLAPDALFGAIRKNGNFRFHINSMLDRMAECLRDQMEAGSFAPAPINGYTSPPGKSAGRLFDNTCYNATPPGYFAHWQDMFFAAQPDSGTFSVTVDGLTQNCDGVLIFAGQRGSSQLRATDTERNTIANYLEGSNLAGLMGAGTGFSGQSQFNVVSNAQAAHQDIVRCIQSGATMETVNSQDLLNDGFGPMASYDPGTRTLTLGSEDAETDKGASGSTLYGCAWTVAANTRGNGFRSYFTMRFMGITGGVGNNGFVFAAIDGENNTTSVCGAAGSHLGYSGDNRYIDISGNTIGSPPVLAPKIGIEFDQGRDTGTVSTALNSGRNDPCGASSCGGTVGYNSHSAIVYWGDRALNYDDNVHGAGTLPTDPRNPNVLTATPPGIAFVNYRANEDSDSDGQLDSYLYHVRVEVVPVAAPSPLSEVRVAAAGNIAISTPGAAIDGVAMASGDRVLLAAQSNAAENGVYVWTADDAPLTRAADADTGAEVTDAGVAVTAGHHVGDWRQTNTITTIDTDIQSWQPAVRRFQTQAWIVRDSDTTAVIRSAMQDTTTAMATSYPGYTAKLSDTAIMFASAGAACTTSADCTSGQTCGLDNVCYRPALKSVRLGFTNSQRTQDQKVIISNFSASWPL
jgi:type II secretory pathway pseudopilin PulG